MAVEGGIGEERAVIDLKYPQKEIACNKCENTEKYLW